MWARINFRLEAEVHWPASNYILYLYFSIQQLYLYAFSSFTVPWQTSFRNWESWKCQIAAFESRYVFIPELSIYLAYLYCAGLCSSPMSQWKVCLSTCSTAAVFNEWETYISQIVRPFLFLWIQNRWSWHSWIALLRGLIRHSQTPKPEFCRIRFKTYRLYSS